ncbi:GNAT family N-acetyltransferase [Alkaliphilus hydrothermalis]|uniref:N-acetylglutamate synthase-like GNAT family acetyltransferase n=1 Tax=Alkaliphilus hydrothermalis TaxID=1482730 RepID=A0ABS2NN12_9FIRM|nr:GNAT family N-acetyltransferase [Alkaliphilus hydrothermalis]MBM7614340.1 N-acetylglutamate synthase-like GNAT family acetyltransferase [Alkaliphilus hydrothermalis]
MKISIRKATLQDCETIHHMQRKAFASLLEKYKDYDTNPGKEEIDQIYRRFNQSFTDYYLIEDEDKVLGAIRIIRKENENMCRVSPIFILPKYQGLGIAQKVFNIIENTYPWARKWELDTILQEQGHCYLYEKLGYKKTGRENKINEKMTIVYYEKMMDDLDK